MRFLGVRVAVERNFEHDFSHHVDAVATVKKAVGRGERGETAGGEEHDDDDINIAAIAVVTAALNATINQQ